MNHKILIISAKQGGGKTTLADAIRSRAKDNGFSAVKVVKFASPLYVMHEFILNKMEGWTGKPRKPKDGPLLQLLGTDWGRKTHGANVWVNILRDAMEADTYSKVLYIIDDCRFENEFDAFPEALKVRLEASEEARKARCPEWRPNTNHPSETGLDRYAGYPQGFWNKLLVKMGLKEKPKSKFHLTFRTDRTPMTPVEDIAEVIMAYLLDETWRTNLAHGKWLKQVEL